MLPNYAKLKSEIRGETGSRAAVAEDPASHRAQGPSGLVLDSQASSEEKKESEQESEGQEEGSELVHQLTKTESLNNLNTFFTADQLQHTVVKNQIAEYDKAKQGFVDDFEDSQEDMRRLSFKRAREMQTEAHTREVGTHNEPQPVDKRSIVIEPSSPR